MKKLLLFITLMIGMLAAQATDYPYLTFETIDGSKYSVLSSSLTITISGATLTVNNREFTLTNLSKMYFSTTNETSGITTITVDDMDDIIEVYDLNGREMSKESMPSGVYIARSKSGTFKVVKK